MTHICECGEESHDYVWEWDAGMHWATCVCGSEIPASYHSFDNDGVCVEPTCLYTEIERTTPIKSFDMNAMPLPT